jgi:hypothetical protein
VEPRPPGATAGQLGTARTENSRQPTPQANRPGSRKIEASACDAWLGRWHQLLEGEGAEQRCPLYATMRRLQSRHIRQSAVMHGLPGKCANLTPELGVT